MCSEPEVARFAAMKPTRVSLHSWLNDLVNPQLLAEFLCQEMPIRFAERIRLIEDLPEWTQIPELVEVHNIQLTSFQAFRAMPLAESTCVSRFGALVEDVLDQESPTKNLMMAAAMKLRHLRGIVSFRDGPALGINKLLDDFLLNRLGCNMLMAQYVACTGPTPRLTGIIHPQCDAVTICKKAALEVRRRCERAQGRSPEMNVTGYTTSGEVATSGGAPGFSYIPGILMHVVRELLKNSAEETLNQAKSVEDLQNKPINVIVCADQRHVVIRITDRAKGIPLHAGTRIWSYLYAGRPTAMAGLSYGHGIGLPLSRLHARYLGGSLDLVSLPGYGVDAYLNLPRVETDLVEVVPDGSRDIAQEINLLTL